MSGRARYARPGIRGYAPGFLNFPDGGGDEDFRLLARFVYIT